MNLTKEQINDNVAVYLSNHTVDKDNLLTFISLMMELNQKNSFLDKDKTTIQHEISYFIDGDIFDGESYDERIPEFLEYIIKRFSPSMSDIEIQEFYASKDNYLIEAQIGFEDENGFTGVYIFDNQSLYIIRNEVQRSDYISETFEDRQEEDFRKVYDYYHDNILKMDFDKVVHLEIAKNKIYGSYIFSNYNYFSIQNSESNPFSGRPDCVDEWFMSDEKKIEIIKRRFTIAEELMRLERRSIVAEYSGNQELIDEVNKALSDYGFKYVGHNSKEN